MHNGKKHPVHNVILFTDIDGTLCFTRDKFRKYVGDERTLGDACVFDKHGKALSYQSDKQALFLSWLSLAATVIPITGRSTEKYLQVDLGFNSYAITSFGAVILDPDGKPDTDWQRHIELSAIKYAQGLHQLIQVMATNQLSRSIKTTVVSEYGRRLFLKVYDADGDAGNLEAPAELLAGNLPDGWTLHHNEGQLCAYPQYLDKVKAAQYLLAQIAGQDSLIIGVGDSLTDAGFMSACDFMIAPIQSQLFESINQS